MRFPLCLPQGYHELDGPVVDCEVDFSTAYHENVVLTASIDDGQGVPIMTPPRGRTGTVLAFRMDQRAAMKLHARLTDLIQTTGWQTSKDNSQPK
jgi:hypothetical protein